MTSFVGGGQLLKPTTMKHTPTPWHTSHAFPQTVTDGENYLFNGTLLDINTNIANAKRIVECVNACEGMEDPTKEIEALKAKYKELEQKYNDTAAGDAFYQTEMKILDQENDKLRAENERLKQKATP